MNKELEGALAIIKIKCHPNSNPSSLVDGALDIIEQALIKEQMQEKENAELKSIIQNLEKDLEEQRELAKHYLEEQENVLSILKEKEVDIGLLKRSENWLDYYTRVKHRTGKTTELTEEEYNLLKRYLV